MFELNGLFLGSGKLPETSETGVNEGLQDNAKNEDNPFGAILDEKLMVRAAAKSGNGAEESGNKEPILESDSKLQTRILKGGIELALGGVEPSQDVIADYAKSQGLDADLIEILMTDGVGGVALEKEVLLDPLTLEKLASPAILTDSREALYDTSRTLEQAERRAVPIAVEALTIQHGQSIMSRGSLAVKPELEASEKPQGLLPQAMNTAEALLNSTSTLKADVLNSNSVSSEATKVSASAPTEAVIPQKGRSIAASDLPTMKPGLQASETIQVFRDQVVKPTQAPQSSASALRSSEVLKPNSVSSEATKVSASAPTEAVIPQKGRSIAASDLPVAKAEPKTAVLRQGSSAHALSFAEAELNYAKASLTQNDRKTSVTDLSFVKLEPARLPANPSPLGYMTRVTVATLAKGDYSVANNDITIAKPESARAINASATPNARLEEAQIIVRQAQSKVEAPEQATLIIPTKLSKEIKTLEPRGAAIEKLTPIKLPASAETIISHNQHQRPSLIKQPEASIKDLSSGVITQLTSSSRVNSSDKPGLDQIENLGKQDTLRRQDQYLDLSRRLTDALGQRLTAQISRGSWHVEMELHPRTLGRIEIQLEMKNGELEAHFNASRATTRDLIQEGLPRLRAELEQHGTDSAYEGVGQQNNGESDGKPTGADHSGNEVESEDQGPEPQERTKLKAVHKQGLDIQV
tara:strand:- start:3004 stop:5091 length:2088 start_codon:yes stop_codon:yes gene_type:complete